MIQVMIAEVTLNNTDEFGIELGLQNSVMFDRSLLSGFQLINTVSNQANPGGGVITVQNQSIVGANNTPGYDFNNPTLQGALPPTGVTTATGPFSIGLPNSGATTSLRTASQLGSQGLSNFGMGRTNGDLGFGGLVLSLSSDTVNFLLRALRERRRLDVLSRPQVMTLDNQPAYIVVGQKVPLLSGSALGLAGAVTNVQYTNVGLIVAVTPRVAPDGLVVMEIDAEKSLLGPLNEGIPVGFGALGQVLRQPRIDITQAQTTISAMDGQTIVFGGLITQSSQVIQRRVPGISEIPIIGRLFRYDYQNGKKSELLIIMTPHVVRNQFDAEKLKRTEAGRISWCLADVRKIHGEAGLRNRGDEWLDHEIPTIYPDMDPTGRMAPDGEVIPAPPAMPAGPRGFSPGGQPIRSQPPQAMRPAPAGQGTQTGVNVPGARTANRPDTSRRTGPGNEVRIRSMPPPVQRPPEAVERAGYQPGR
jgi:general secretion pathway protein D